jgi:hypothetical protein
MYADRIPLPQHMLQAGLPSQMLPLYQFKFYLVNPAPLEVDLFAVTAIATWVEWNNLSFSKKFKCLTEKMYFALKFLNSLET